MKQKQYSPMSVAEMGISLFSVDRGYLDDVPLNKIGDFEAGLLAFARANHAALVDKINATGDYNDEIESGIKKVVEDFKAHYVG
ncbi:MAG: atpA [Proteobacteria bacterium]|nr:atpA [Pseudomonadota bacterium]